MSEIIVTKTCTKCKIEKALEDFPKNRNKKDGHHCWCKICNRTATHRYYKTERGKQKIRERRRTEKGRNGCRKRWQKWARSEQGRSYLRAYGKMYRKLRVAHFREKARDYHKRNPQRRKAQAAVNYEIRKGNIPSIHTMRCELCGKTAQHYHHPMGHDKVHWFDVVPLCAFCHLNVHGHFLPRASVNTAPS